MPISLDYESDIYYSGGIVFSVAVPFQWAAVLIIPVTI
jgi:hypothetical protein